jgi:hypothetical protein
MYRTNKRCNHKMPWPILPLLARNGLAGAADGVRSLDVVPAVEIDAALPSRSSTRETAEAALSFHWLITTGGLEMLKGMRKLTSRR